ncbi:MAG TPA: class I SAM-dependent methyltransferase [Acidimicrobiales bacterium]|nr:class I SAM-dependent methyltransferase [Acidimicrobiales bacterium]
MSPAHLHHRELDDPSAFSGLLGLASGLSMTVGRGTAARFVADLAELSADDRVVDVGCGPGTAVRVAARRAGSAVGVDPAPVMLRLARALTKGSVRARATYAEGTAEALPLPDGSVTVAWALSSAHHWSDVETGLGELRRVLAPGGRFFIVERLSRPGARGHAAHGFTAALSDEVIEAARSAGFSDVARSEHRPGRRQLVVVSGHRAP